MSLADATFEVEMRRDVARGASRLDVVEPGWWTEARIDTSQVNMRHVSICIAGWTARTSERFTADEKLLIKDGLEDTWRNLNIRLTFERLVERLLEINSIDYDGDLPCDYGFDTECLPAYDMLKHIWVDEIHDRRNAHDQG